MRIAYVTLFDATDVRNWSGTDLHVWRSLEAQGAEVELIGNLSHGRSAARKVRNLWSKYVERRDVLHFWDVATSRSYCQDAQTRLRRSNADVIVSPSPIPLAFLNDPRPKCLWTDAIYSGLERVYWEFSPTRISSLAARCARQVDRAVCRNVDALVFASEWGAKWAIRNAASPPDRTHIVPFGANMDVRHTAEDVATFVAVRPTAPIEFLFSGVDWERKGADKAIDVVAGVRARGVDARLTMIGCLPSNGRTLPSFVKPLGFISKETSEGRQQIEQLYRESHFLIVPTVADAYGLVFAEASAFGVPSLSHRVGGVTTVVRDEINGRLFDAGQPVDAWVEWVVSTLRRPGRIAELSNSSFLEYQSRLNWKVAGQRVFTLLCELVEASKRGGTSPAHAAALASAQRGNAQVFSTFPAERIPVTD